MLTLSDGGVIAHIRQMRKVSVHRGWSTLVSDPRPLLGDVPQSLALGSFCVCLWEGVTLVSGPRSILGYPWMGTSTSPQSQDRVRTGVNPPPHLTQLGRIYGVSVHTGLSYFGVYMYACLPCLLALFWRPVVWVVFYSCRRQRRGPRTVAPPRGGRLPGSRSRSNPES